MKNLILLLPLLAVNSVLSTTDLIIISPPASEKGLDTFRISAKSQDVVAKVGDTIDLTCRTSRPWHLCSWYMPKGDWCHRLSSEKYATSCKENERIRFQVS